MTPSQVTSYNILAFVLFFVNMYLRRNIVEVGDSDKIIGDKLDKDFAYLGWLVTNQKNLACYKLIKLLEPGVTINLLKDTTTTGYLFVGTDPPVEETEQYFDFKNTMWRMHSHIRLKSDRLMEVNEKDYVMQSFHPIFIHRLRYIVAGLIHVVTGIKVVTDPVFEFEADLNQPLYRFICIIVFPLFRSFNLKNITDGMTKTVFIEHLKRACYGLYCKESSLKTSFKVVPQEITQPYIELLGYKATE